MARAATTADAFNAVAEPRRRRILDILAGQERAVGDLVVALGLAQPLVSKHLKVLLEVGLVSVRTDGRQRLYRVEARGLRPIYDWVRGYEAMWEAGFDRLDAVLDGLKPGRNGDGGGDRCRDRGRDPADGTTDSHHPHV